MSQTNFDRTDKASIFKHSIGLVGRCLRDFANEEEILQLPAGDKGKLGKLVEYLYFKYPINNNPEADFAEAGMELKCTGLKNGGVAIGTSCFVASLYRYAMQPES